MSRAGLAQMNVDIDESREAHHAIGRQAVDVGLDAGSSSNATQSLKSLGVKHNFTGQTGIFLPVFLSAKQGKHWFVMATVT